MGKMDDKVVAYYYDQEIGNYNYGNTNPMRPHRVRLTHSLVENYGLSNKLSIHRPNRCTEDDLELFHADEYVDFLKSVTPDNQDEYLVQMRRFNLGPAGEADCPVFDCMFDYCATYSGGSVCGASLINQHKADIVLNWAGGMHHAKKAEASGFCYINDIVLAILELLKVHQRVLYVDIDIHHGDGVEEAFYLTNRVMTVSFHKYGDFFPGTGALGDTGWGDGKGYSVNVPLQEGMDDESYRFMFEPIMRKVMEVYNPGAIVVCGGADSLSGDRLGCFNLSLQGHAHCMDFLAGFGKPMLVLGGGGYTLRNVARCWCYETGRLLGSELDDALPDKALQEFDYYTDTHKLRISVSNMKNANTREKLEHIKTTVLENLSRLPAPPGAQMVVPPPQIKMRDDPEEEMEVRGGGQYYDEKKVKQDAAYDSDDEAGARHVSDARDAAPPPYGQAAARYIPKGYAPAPAQEGMYQNGAPGQAPRYRGPDDVHPSHRPRAYPAVHGSHWGPGPVTTGHTMVGVPPTAERSPSPYRPGRSPATTRQVSPATFATTVPGGDRRPGHYPSMPQAPPP